MQVLITGASGFLGRHLLERLGQDHEVVGLCRRPGSDDRLVAGDVLDPGSLTGPMAGCDAVVHAAGGVSHRQSDADWLFEVHVTGTENVMDAAAEAGVDTVLYVSTSGTVAVSEQDRVLDEESPDPLPVISRWPYYRVKRTAEKAALKAGAIVVNPTLLLGPGDRDESSTKSVRILLEGSVPAVPKGGLSFVDVRDVADGVALALERGEGGERYLLGAVNLTFTEYYERLARTAGVKPPAITLPAATRTVLGWLPDRARQAVADRFGVDQIELQMASHYWYLDAGKARRELGWTPRDPGETLADTVEDVRARLNA